VAQVVAQEWQNEAQEHKEKLNEVWKFFSREKIIQRQCLFWFNHLGWASEEYGRVGGSFFAIRFGNPLQKTKKNDFRLIT